MATHPSYETDERREYQRAYRASGRDRSSAAGRNRLRPFVGFDGEGGNLAGSDYHAYFLCSSGRSGITPYRGNARLTTRQCLDFITDFEREAIHVVFFGDYDVTKILEDLPFRKLERLMDRSLRQRQDGRGTMPVSYDEFDLDYLPRKEFKVRKNNGPWVVINDVGPFFQCPFVKALELWDIGTPKERALIGRGKEARGTFTFSDLPDVARYNALEIELLQKLMEKFRAACIEVGVVPARWQGPGQLAEALFAKFRVPKSTEVPLLSDPAYDGLLDFARSAFYGGRPEIGCVGPCDVPVWQWDINSAYPAAMCYVPCLIHGEWIHDDGAADGDYAIHFGSFDPVPVIDGQRPPQFYGLPVRDKQGNISYPGSGRGWYWSFEIQSSVHQEFRTEEAWTYVRQCDCAPLAFVEDVYQERLRMGKDGPGMILKLALNSLYGKTVQSVGRPRYANPIWGSFITAWCRTKVQQFLHSSSKCPTWCGSDVLMIATDSVCTTTERTDLTPSKVLGGWSVETHPGGMFIVQPGLYFGTSGKPSKTRGVPRNVIETREQDFRDAFARMVASRDLSDGDLRVDQQMFVGIRAALHWKNMKLLGQWISFVDPLSGETGKRISFDWHTKRLAYPVLEPSAISGMPTWLLTFPKPGDATLCTIPYSKDIGGVKLISTIRQLFEAQPDWGEDVTIGFPDAR